MKKSRKGYHLWSVISVLLVLCLTMVFFTLTAYAENVPMDTVIFPDGTSLNVSYVTFLEIDENGDIKFDKDGKITAYDIYSEGEVHNDALNGAVYDRASNTLTITDLKAENLVLETNCMGDDFNLNIVGDCEMARIRIWGYGYGGTLNIIGNGTLSVNTKKLYDNAIILYPEGSNSSLNFGKNVHVNLYAKVDAAKIFDATYTDADKAFTFSNGQNYTVTKNNAVGEREVYYKGYESSVLDSVSYKEKVVNSADPEGVYGCSKITKYDEEGNVTAAGVTITKLVYNEKYNAYFKDPSVDEQFLTDEEFTNSTYSYSVDGDGNKEFYSCHLYGSTYKIYTDGKGNLYAIYKEWSSVSEDKYAMTFEKIDGTEEYVFTPDKTVDISTLKPYIEKTVIEGLYIYTLTGTEFVYPGLPQDTHTHTYKTTTTKATTTKDGKKVTACKVCGEVLSTAKIYKASSIKLSKTSYTYNGKAQKPTVTVKNSKGEALKNGTDYTVSYASGCKNTGKYAVKVKFKGNYSGTKTLYFSILPSKTSKLTATQTTSSIKATWKAVTGASGYKVVIYKGSKAVKTVYTTKTTYSFTKLSKGTIYKVRVTAYKTIDGKRVASSVYTQLTTATRPGTPTLKVTAGAKKASLSWNKQTGASGYVVYMATSKNGTYKKIATIKGGTKVSYTKTGLTKGKTYSFKVAAYKTVDGKNIYGAYSAAKSGKIK